jgi:flagellar biosynthetic protein FliQ
MTEQFAIDVAQKAFLIALQIGGPLLAVSLTVGMLVSVFQAVTQINEQSLSFVPKMLVIAGTLAMLGPWMAQTLISYMVSTFNSLATLAH